MRRVMASSQARRHRSGGSAHTVIAGGLLTGLSVLLLMLRAAAKSPRTNGQIVHGNNRVFFAQQKGSAACDGLLYAYG